MLASWQDARDPVRPRAKRWQTDASSQSVSLSPVTTAQIHLPQILATMRTARATRMTSVTVNPLTALHRGLRLPVMLSRDRSVGRSVICPSPPCLLYRPDRLGFPVGVREELDNRGGGVRGRSPTVWDSRLPPSLAHRDSDLSDGVGGKAIRSFKMETYATIPLLVDRCSKDAQKMLKCHKFLRES